MKSDYGKRPIESIGMCLPTCRCRQCRSDKYEIVDRSYSSGINTSVGVVVNTRFAPDGSRLEKPLSQTYIEHIRNRRSDNLHKLKPNMGSYGA